MNVGWVEGCEGEILLGGVGGFGLDLDVVLVVVYFVGEVVFVCILVEIF